MPTDFHDAHAAIDDTLADSFPASDPPSFTPVTGATNSDRPRDDTSGSWFPRIAVFVAAAGVLLIAAKSAIGRRHKRRSLPDRLREGINARASA